MDRNQSRAARLCIMLAIATLSASGARAADAPVAAVSSPMTVAVNPVGPTAIPTVPGKSYETLVAAAKANPEHADYDGLRDAYASSAAYNPLLNQTPEHKVVFQEIKAENWVQSAADAEAALAVDWTDLNMHMLAALAYHRLGEEAKAKPHVQAATGLFKSILHSGDGKSPKTAYSVITISEEYSVLGILHLTRTKQELLKIDGHQYDRLDVASAQGLHDPLYFQVDRPFAGSVKVIMKEIEKSKLDKAKPVVPAK